MRSSITFVIELLIFLGVLLVGYNIMNDKLKISEQNLLSYKSKVESLELANGELVTSRNSYILKYNQLETEFEISKQEIKDLENKLGSSLAYISEIESNMHIDTILCINDSIVYINDNKEIYFDYLDDWVSFNGKSFIMNNMSNTSLYNIKMNVPITVGITDDYKLFVKSSNPYVSFTNIKGSVIDGSNLIQKEKRWSWGLQGGIGISYDMITKNLGLGPYFGVGVEYKF